MIFVQDPVPIRVPSDSLLRYFSLSISHFDMYKLAMFYDLSVVLPLILAFCVGYVCLFSSRQKHVPK